MRSSIVLFTAALAGSSMAMPWNVPVKPTGYPTSFPSKPHPSGSGISPPPPPGTSVPPVSPPPVGPSSSSTAVTGITTTYSTTETITKTSFVPTSSPIALPGGTTKYSTWLTSEVYTTTTCFPVTSVEPFTTSTPVPAPPVVTSTVVISEPAPVSTCPAPAPPTTVTATATVTVTSTQLPPGATIVYPAGSAPQGCDKCQTITYTDISSSVCTIVIPGPTSEPGVPAPPVTTAATETTSKPAGTPTPPWGTGSSSVPQGTGTGAPLPPWSSTSKHGPFPTGKYPKPSGW